MRCSPGARDPERPRSLRTLRALWLNENMSDAQPSKPLSADAIQVQTPWTKAASAAARWNDPERFSYFGPALRTPAGDAAATGRALAALGPAPSPEAVNAVIGNDCWTRCVCDLCKGSPGEPPLAPATAVLDFGDYKFDVCDACLDAARAAIANVLARSP